MPPMYRVRKCSSPDDVDELHKLVKELAAFEKDADAVLQTLDDYRRDAFETQPTLFHAAFAECADIDGTSAGEGVVEWEVVRYVTWSHVHSLWKGKGAHLDDRP